jgi:hypothetical protein
VEDDLLVRYWSPANTSSKVLRQIIVPKKIRPKLMHIAHTNPFGAHMGVNKTKIDCYNAFIGHPCGKMCKNIALVASVANKLANHKIKTCPRLFRPQF